MVPARAFSALLCDLCAPHALCVKSFSAIVTFAALFVIALITAIPAPAPQAAASRSYLGFDRNIYPGDEALPILRKTFSFTSYWLSPPPGEKDQQLAWEARTPSLAEFRFSGPFSRPANH